MFEKPSRLNQIVPVAATALGLACLTPLPLSAQVVPLTGPTPISSPASGTPGTQPTTVKTAQAAPTSKEPIGNDVVLDNADASHIDEETGVITLTGNVRLRYRSYLLWADTAVIDLDKGQGTLSGHVALATQDGKTHAQATSPNSILTLNLREGTYSLVGGESAVIAPNQLPSTGLLLPLRLFGGDISGEPHVIDARNAVVTTCDFPTPHYAFGASSMTIVPGKHLIARHVTLYRKGRPIVTLPWFWLPLSNRYANQNLTPQLGQSPDEGYFAKFADPYVLAATALGVLRLDLMQNKGVGTGVDQSYQLHSNPANNQGGTVKLYHLYDNSLHLNSWTGSWIHNQNLFDGFILGLNSQFQQNSFNLSQSQSQTVTSQMNLIRTTPDAATQIAANWQQSDFGDGLERNLSSSVFQHEVLSKYSHLDIKLGYAQFATLSSFAGASTNSQSLTSNLDFVTNPKGYALEFLVNAYSALGGRSTGNLSSLGGVQRLPEVKLQTDPALSASHMLWDQLLPRLSSLLLDLGEFSEGISGMRTNRLEFGFDLGNHSDRRAALTTTYAGSFQQYFYGDNTAQYILTGQSGWQYGFQKMSSLSIKYSYLRPYGFTPFFFDRSGFYNNASANLNYEPNPKIILTMGTGYDFTQNKSQFGLPAAPWQSLLAQMTIKPTPNLGTRLTATYDPNHGQLFDITDQIQAKGPSGFALNTSARYIPQQQTFAEVDSSLDLPLIVDKREDAGYRLQALEGYNGYTQAFSYKGLALTRSWHDWELSAVYEDIPSGIRPGQTFYLNLRLKAFPGYQPFGVGALGQGLDTGIGEIL